MAMPGGSPGTRLEKAMAEERAAQAQPNAQTHHTSRTSDHPVLS